MQPGDVIDRQDRVAFFVDAANADQAARDLGFAVDWKRALDHLRGPGRFAGAFYFTARWEEDKEQRRFLDELADIGFVIRAKPVKLIRNRQGEVIDEKANLDIELALEMVATLDNYDVAYLFSGDSDFRRVVELVQARGKRVHVVASRRTLSRELLHISTKPVHYLDELRGELAREG